MPQTYAGYFAWILFMILADFIPFILTTFGKEL